MAQSSPVTLAAHVPPPITLDEPTGSPPRQWTLSFSPEAVHATSAGQPDRVVAFADRFDGITTFGTAISITHPKALLLKTAPETLGAITAWMGPPTRDFLRDRLKKLVGQGLTTGGAVMVFAFMGDGVRGFALWFGLPLLVLGLLARVVVHRGLFLGMAIVYAVNIAVLGFTGLTGGPKWLLLVAVFLLMSVWVHYREFKRFEGVQ